MLFNSMYSVQHTVGHMCGSMDQKHSALTKISPEGLSSSSDSIARPEPQAAAVPAALVDVAPAGHAPQNSSMDAFEGL